MQARQARSKQSAKASNARRQPGKQRTRATSKAPHVPFLSFPHPLFQIAPTALDERERGPSPTILGIRIQEAQYSETLVPIYPLHAKDTATRIAGFWQTFTPIYTIIKCKLVGIEVPKILPLCSKRLPGPLVGYIFWAYPFKRCNILKPLSPFTLFMLRIVLCNAIQCLPLVFALGVCPWCLLLRSTDYSRL